MTTELTVPAPVLLLAEASAPKHQHAELLMRAGLHVVRLPPHEINSRLLEKLQPAVIAAELDDQRRRDVLDLAARLRESTGPRSERVPVIVYGHGLSSEDIEAAARGGAMWLQLEPSDGQKLVSAIRGVLTAAGIVIKST